MFSEQQVGCPTSPEIQLPQAHSQICSWKPDVIYLFSLCTTSRDHEDLGFQDSFAQFIPDTQPSTPAYFYCEQTVDQAKKISQHTITTLKVQQENRKQEIKHPPNKQDESRNYYLEI